MKEITLPSGGVLKIGDTPFAESKALYQAVLEELKAVKMDSQMDHLNFIKDLMCFGFSSKKVDDALNVCFKRCLYNENRIDEKSFEPVSARQDYSKICIAVMEENITPFLKGLSVELNRLLEFIPGSPK